MDQELKEQFDKLGKRFDSVESFLFKHMTTKEELQEMRSELADKKDIDRVLTAVDGIAKQMNDYNQNLPAINQQLRNINDWIKLASEKIGIHYDG
jgi:chromosome segregation ATPase